ncbi:head-tail joining protein [Profundibacter sp.]
MTVLPGALAAIFANPIMARDATLFLGGSGAGTPIRVIARQPDDVTTFAGARVFSETLIIDVLASAAPNLAPGDRIDLNGASYTVQGEPVRDAERLIWTAELVPA